MVERSLARRLGDVARALLLFGKVAVLSAVVLLILAAGVWSSWKTAQYIVLPQGRERGTMTVAACGGNTCTGPYLPDNTGTGTVRAKVTIDKSLTRRTGEKIPVTVEPGTDVVVRTGWAGGLQAWIPLGGALLLTTFVFAAGMRMPRAAWVSGLAGAALLGAAYVAL
jgi:hypothetical protein